ncbi:NAD(P)H:quinone oxidoreductase [Dactylosporangium fulvum]|uniref:NAD(P)H-dependent oxidoreductase n=1 Tax=Dactylosporangium fulvum TaxID=53359 RepID=A0ABY5WC97_9ACTN|nr:NAD(P)H-dependent oxidoreductase [Dactylosporangium fulvum]UWP87147.1 NAD(P)H-dependent oxidoreductase [Dactylosporangium fulvum]
MTNVTVIFYSSTGNVFRLAEAAADAAVKAGADVRLRRIPELVAEPTVTDRDAWLRHTEATRDVPEATLDDLDWAGAILVGTPVRFGLPAPQLMHFLDTTAPLSIGGRLAGKAVGAFTSGSAPHGGQVSTILALHNTFCHWGAVIVPTGSTDPVLFRPTNGNPYGASNVSRNQPGNVTDDNLAAVEFQTRRTIAVAAALAAGTDG